MSALIHRLAYIPAGLALALVLSSCLQEPNMAKSRNANSPLDAVILSRLTLRYVDLYEAVERIQKETLIHASGSGIRMIVALEATQQKVSTDPFEHTRAEQPKVYIDMRDVSVRRVLDELCRQTGSQWYVESGVVFIVRQPAGSSGYSERPSH